MSERHPQRDAGVGIAVGAGVGVALGTAFHNMALGVAIGVAIGAALGAASLFNKQNSNNDGAGQPPKDG